MNDEAPLIDFSESLSAIGVYLRERARSRFLEQEFGGQQWQERGVPNIAGIISDIQERGRTAANIPARRFDARPALIDTGTLRRSISYRIEDDQLTVTVGSNLPYARKMQEGGESTFQIDARTRSELLKLANSALVKSQPDAERIQRALVATANKDEVTVSNSRRTFIGIDDEDVQEIFAILDATL